MILRGEDARQQWHWTPYFVPREFECKHCHALLVETDLMDRLVLIRAQYGKPMIVASGYRCPTYNNSVSFTGLDGPHTRGAVDLSVRGTDAHRLLYVALSHGIRGIGVQQKGAARFLHLDMLPDDARQPRPWVWTY